MKTITTKTKVNALECPTCGDLIYSRDRHDFHYCSCEEIAVDGGFDYLRIAFKKVLPKTVRIYVDATKEELFEDWNQRINKFGVIKSLTTNKKSRKVKTVKG